MMQNNCNDFFYGKKPTRPKRAIHSPLSNPSIRLMTGDDLDRFVSNSTDKTLTLPCTTLTESSPEGDQLQGRVYGGLPISNECRSLHTLVVGATGAGKTYAFSMGAIASMLLQCDDSIVITNLKGRKGTKEILGLARQFAPDIEVHILSPGDQKVSMGCNLLDLARQNDLVPQLIRTICSSISHTDRESNFWKQNTRKILTALSRYEQIGSIASMNEVLNNESILKNFGDLTHDPEINAYIHFVNSGSNGATSRADASARLAPFCDTDALRSIFSGDETFDLSSLFQTGKRFILIIEADEVDFENSKYAIGLFLSLLFSIATKIAGESETGRLDRPISFFLDEFGVLPRIPDFDKVANLGRSRGLTFHCLVQTIQQINSIYGGHAEAVIAALCNKIFFTKGLSLFDRLFASTLCGQIVISDWVQTESMDPHTNSWTRSSRSSIENRRPLLTPDDFLIPPDPVFGSFVYIMLVSESPLLAHLTPSYEIPQMSDAMNSMRGIGLERPCPLPNIPRTGLIELQSGVDALADPNRSISERIEDVKKSIRWDQTKGAAREWWLCFEEENQHRLELIMKVVKELDDRKSSIMEFYLAYVYSNTNNIQGVLHYLDFSKIKKEEDKKNQTAKKLKGQTPGQLENGNTWRRYDPMTQIKKTHQEFRLRSRFGNKRGEHERINICGTTMGALIAANIFTDDQLASLTDEELLAIAGIDETDLAMIHEYLAEKGVD